MSVHFRVSDAIASLLHRNPEPARTLPPPTRKQLLLIACYQSGQIEENIWQQHLDRDIDLAAQFDEAVRYRSMH